MPFSLTETERTQICEDFRRILNADVDATLNRLRDQRRTVVLNADDLFKLLPRYEDNLAERKFLGPLLYEVAREFTDVAYARLLNRPVDETDTVVFLAGGSASGKSTILRRGRRTGVDFIVDTTFSNAERALSQVDQALASGRQVKIFYVYRDFLESCRGMLERANHPESGRVVPVDDMARTHFGMQRAILQALSKYQEDPRVTIQLRENTKQGKLRSLSEQAFAKRLYPSVDSLQKKGQSYLDGFRKKEGAERSNNRQNHDPGGRELHVSAALYEAAQSKTQMAERPSG